MTALPKTYFLFDPLDKVAHSLALLPLKQRRAVCSNYNPGMLNPMLQELVLYCNLPSQLTAARFRVGRKRLREKAVALAL